MIKSPNLKPFRIERTFKGPIRDAAIVISRPILESLLAFRTMNSIYADVHAEKRDLPFAEKVLGALNIGYDVPDEDLQNVPRSGPVVVVSNHPIGGVEGLILTALLQRIRPDVKVLANYVLSRLPELHDTQIYVDPFGRAGSAERNIAAIRSAIQWVGQGGLLAVFPAGEVAHYTWHNGAITDPPWNDTVARIIRRSKAAALPVFFDGRNSRMFQALGLVHPRLRTVMLPREMLKKRSRTIALRVGSLIPFEQLQKFQSPAELTAYLRLRTYILRSRTQSAKRRRFGVRRQETTSLAASRVPAAQPTEAILEEVERLSEDRLMVRSGDHDVYCARPPEIPRLLREIGRLRELTFRDVGEGTGKAVDLDRFDGYYLHLFVWNRKEKQLVGAYRLGATDEILPRYGVDGLYTSTLFYIKRRLLQQLGPAIELGRSFVLTEHQKSYAPLMLLWKGIGRYLVLNPHYRHLFGAVSISNDYHSMTKQLLLTFLKASGYESDLRRLIRPKNPPRKMRSPDINERLVAKAACDLRDVDCLVSEIEADHKPMPVLLRQYLRLNGKLLGFNVDPDFGNVLDGLLLVRLEEVDRPILVRYFGREGLDSYLAYKG